MKLLLIDGLNIIRRVYAAVPTREDEPDSPSHIEGTLSSSTTSLKRALNNHQPSHCIVVFEGNGPSWRHSLFPDYKKDRSSIPTALSAALPNFKSAFDQIGLVSYSLDGYEADDVIATLATKTAQSGGDAVILSTDRLLCQLLSDNIRQYDHFAQQYLDHNTAIKKYSVRPHLIPDALALAGDSGLSIPGVKSVGIKTAARLINEFGSLNSVLENAETISGKVGEHIKANMDAAHSAYSLFQLKTDIDLGINLNQLRVTHKSRPE